MFVITGCGRSGTGYLADRLNAAGIKCGHEKVFKVDGTINWDGYEGDSSWFAAPRIGSLQKGTPIIHIVRDPIKVVRSFYRIGLFSNLSWRNFVINPTFEFVLKKYILNPRNVLSRYKHVKQYRKILRYNSNCFKYSNEIERIWRYWYDWNTLIEKGAEEAGLSYLRVRLEDVDNRWEEIKSHLDIINSIKRSDGVNRKTEYPKREMLLLDIPEYIKNMAVKYGYNSYL